MTLQELQALYAKRKKLIEDSRSFLDGIESEKREMTTEENERYDRMFSDIDKFSKQIQNEERMREAEHSAVEKYAKETEETRDKPKTSAEEKAELLIDAARSFLRTGKVNPDHYQAWNDFQTRSLEAGHDVEGGYLTMPEQFNMELIERVRDLVFMRTVSRVFSLQSAASLGTPSLDVRPDDADWTTELATGDEDTAMKFGKRALKPHPLAKRIKISRELIRQTSGMMPIESIVLDQLAFKFGITEEKGFLTGNGAQQPLGVFTANANGITTARDVSTGNTTSSITTDGLKEAFYNNKMQYEMSPSTIWMFHRDGVKQISKLKDGNGRYLWEDAVRNGEPDRLMNKPVFQSEYVPNTFTTGQYVGIIGDFRNYWIADAFDLQIQTLFELYAETNQVGYIARKSTDGMPVLEEAFTRVQLA